MTRDSVPAANLYEYAGNNPVSFSDGNGRWWIPGIENIIDIGFAVYDAYNLITEPSWENAAFLVWDIAAAVVPGVPGSYLGHAAEAMKIGVDTIEAEVRAGRAEAEIAHAEANIAKSESKAAREGESGLKSECHCFTAGTTVLTDKGEKAIEKVQVGDKVLAKDDATGDIAYKDVLALFQKEVEETYNVVVGDETITTTDEHPFWIVGKHDWVKAKDLRKDDVLETEDGKNLPIRDIIVKKERATVYNFEVADYHTYFVGNLKIWTHNACSVHGNSLNTTKPADVYAIRDQKTNQLLRFGETTQGWEKRGQQWKRVFAKKGMNVYVQRLRQGISKREAKVVETRLIKTYEKAFGRRPPFNRNYH